MSTPSSTFTELVSTTMRHRKREVVDNVTKHNGLLTLLKERGNIKTFSGGTEIVMPLSYAENGTYQRYSGYDQLDISASDVITSAKYDPKQVALHITASGRELRLNSGKEAMINLVMARTEVAMATAANTMSVDLYSTGALSNQIGGLGHMITSDGTGTVGGIVAGTWTFWKNKFYEVTGGDVAVDGAATGTALTYANIRSSLNLASLGLTRGIDTPDLYVATHDMFAIYEGGQQELQRYADAKLANTGFVTLQYKGKPIIFDDNANFDTTDELIYCLNTKYLYLMEHPDARWTKDDERTPVNQDAVVVPIYWMGNLCCTNRSLQGRIHDLAT